MKKEITSILCAAAITCSAGAANVSNFSDVRPSDWYHDAVNYVCENGLMNGTSDTAFSPNATTSRGMIVTILYRLAGSPDMPESNWGYPYADVDTNAYYSSLRPSCTATRTTLALIQIPALYQINTMISRTINQFPVTQQTP